MHDMSIGRGPATLHHTARMRSQLTVATGGRRALLLHVCTACEVMSTMMALLVSLRFQYFLGVRFRLHYSDRSDQIICPTIFHFGCCGQGSFT